MEPATFDLNTASAVELCAECPRLGLLLAEDIVAWRGNHGPFTDAASLAALVGHDDELAAELLAGLPPATSRRSTLIDGAPSEAAPTRTSYPSPWAPPEIADEVPAESRDVFTSAPCEAETERIDGFRARLAAARALREAAAAVEPPRPVDEVDEVSEVNAEVNAEVAPIVHADVVDAVSQTVPIEPSAPPPPPRAERPARRRGVQTIALIGIVLANAGLGFGLASLHRDEQQIHAPISAMSAEVKVLESKEIATAVELEHTRTRLDEHEATLAKTVERLNATTQRQDDAERASKERADHTEKEVETMNARVNHMERKVDRERYSIDDIMKAIDLAEGSAHADATKAEHSRP